MRHTISKIFSLALPLAFPLTLSFCVSASADTLQSQLHTCAQFSDDSKRLACYDKLTGNLQQHAEQQFGQEQRAAIEEAPDIITAIITQAEEGAHGKYTFRLDNGQIWRQVGSGRVIWKGGEQVEVERGAFGSFLMRKTRGGRSVRVKRLN
ncbi:hypothetical protein [Microbulbifer sp.]|uniref:hypothetical protein n=1 Tax=Microbulbifer sp. TaxID=1908541 RepID=UPI0025873BB5|nr:hypothetical protein [Microbulbifer sp.]